MGILGAFITGIERNLVLTEKGIYIRLSIHKWLFCSIPVSGSKFNPRNIAYIPAVKIFVFLGLEQIISFLD